ncbi:MAG: thioesterase family protein [Snowella sp.]|nr:thioesterase family protein [Snowella sp.]
MVYSRIIRLSDTDAAGVIYFASLLSICHEAYEDYLAQAGINLKNFFRDSETAIPIVHGEIDFFRPLFCGDRIQVNLTPILLNEHSFEIIYQITVNDCLDKPVAKGLTRHICINPRTRQKLAVPKSIQQALLCESDHSQSTI